MTGDQPAVGHRNPRELTAEDLPDLLAGVGEADLRRVVWAVAGMHAPLDSTGACPWCQPSVRRRRWRRHLSPQPCQTTRVILAQLRTAGVEPSQEPA